MDTRFSSLIIYLIQFTWIILTGSALCSMINQSLLNLSLHGRLVNSKASDYRYMVPKSSFLYFYIFGWIWNGFIFIIWCTAYLSRGSTTVKTLINTGQEIGYCLFMLQLHLSRRTYECLYITKFGQSKMHILAIGLGLGHYLLASISIVSHTYTDLKDDHLKHYLPSIILSGFLFFYASYHQAICNKILGKLKKERQYVVPFGDWFDCLVSPLYTSEILIYLSFVVATHFQHININFLFIWVMVNQSISAKRSYEWYIKTFPSFPKDRWILFKGIW